MSDLITAKRLREERAPLVKQIQDLNDKAQAEQRALSGEEQGQWDKLNKAYDDFTARIQIAERAEKLVLDAITPIDAENAGNQRIGREDYDGNTAKREAEFEAKRDEPTETDRVLALQGWMRAQCDKELRPEHEKACAKTGVRPHAKEFCANLYGGSYKQFRNNLSSQSGVAGNFTVPEGFVTSLERALLQFNGIRGVADVMRTVGGNDMPWPTINSTSNKGRILGENVTDSTTLEPTFGRVIFRAYKYTSDFIKVPVELLEDSAFQLASLLGELQGEAIGRIQADHFTTGTGVNQPTGVVTSILAASATQAAASATAIAFDDIINLQHSVDPAYRAGAIFMCHDSILAAIRKLKDGQGRYLWSSGTQVGAPDTINGAPVVNNQSMDSSIASGAESLLYGDFSKYKIRDAGDIRMVRLNERFADSDQVAFIAFLRSDGNLLNAGVAPIKALQH